MGNGITFGSKGKEQNTVSKQIMQNLDGMIGYAESAKSYYKQGFPTMCHSELDTVIWYAQNIRERIRRKYPEYWK